MGPLHKIDDLILDLSFSTKQCARQEQLAIQEWVIETLLPELDQLFSSYSSTNQVLRFDRIIIDVGTVTVNNYKTAIKQKVVEQLRNQIKDRLSSVNPDLTGDPSLAHDHEIQWRGADESDSQKLINNQHGIDQREKQLYELIEFLLTGNSTKYRSDLSTSIATTTWTQSQWLTRLTKDMPLAEILRSLPNPLAVIRRMVNQFSEAQLAQALRELSPGHFNSISLLMDLIDGVDINQLNQFLNMQAIQQRHFQNTEQESKSFLHGSLIKETLQKETLRNRLWQEVILIFVNSSAENIPFDTWIKAVLEKVSQLTGLTATQLVEYIATTNNSVFIRSSSHKNLANKTRQAFNSEIAFGDFSGSKLSGFSSSSRSDQKRAIPANNQEESADKRSSTAAFTDEESIQLTIESKPLNYGFDQDQADVTRNLFADDNLENDSSINEFDLDSLTDAQIEYLLVGAFNGLDLDFIASHWFAIRLQRPEIAHKILVIYFAQAEVREKIIGALPESFLMDMAFCLEPRVAIGLRAILENAHQLSQFTAPVNKASVQSPSVFSQSSSTVSQPTSASLQLDNASSHLSNATFKQAADVSVSSLRATGISSLQADGLPSQLGGLNRLDNRASMAELWSQIFLQLAQSPNFVFESERFWLNLADVFLADRSLVSNLVTQNSAVLENLSSRRSNKSKLVESAESSVNYQIDQAEYLNLLTQNDLDDDLLLDRPITDAAPVKPASFENSMTGISASPNFDANIPFDFFDQPNSNQHSSNESGSNQPNSNQTNSNQPSYNQPGFNQPGFNQPNSNQAKSNHKSYEQSYDSIDGLTEAQIRASLAEAFSTTDFWFLEENWLLLKSQFAEVLTDSIWHFTKRPEIRLAFTVKISADLWTEIVELVAPNLSSTFLKLLNNAQSIYERMDLLGRELDLVEDLSLGQPVQSSLPPFLPTHVNDWKNDLWQMAFSTIIQQVDAQSSPILFLSHLLTRITPLYHLNIIHAAPLWFGIFDQSLPSAFYDNSNQEKGTDKIAPLNEERAYDFSAPDFTAYSLENSALIKLDRYLLRFERESVVLSDLLAELADSPSAVSNFYSQIKSLLVILPTLGLSQSDWVALIIYYGIANSPQLSEHDSHSLAARAQLYEQSAEDLYRIFVRLAAAEGDHFEAVIFASDKNENFNNSAIYAAIQIAHDRALAKQKNIESAPQNSTMPFHESATSTNFTASREFTESRELTDFEIESLTPSQLVQLLMQRAVPIKQLATLKVDIETLVEEFVLRQGRFSHSVGTDLIRSIYATAELAINQNQYYLVVLDQLIRNQILDLESIASQLSGPQALEHYFSRAHDSEVFASDAKNKIGPNVTDVDILGQGSVVKENKSTPDALSKASAQSKSAFNQRTGDVDLILLSQQVREKSVSPNDIQLADSDWWKLIQIYLKNEPSMVADFRAEVLSAIEAAAQKLTHRIPFYRNVLSALVKGEVIDIEAFASTQPSENTISPQPTRFDIKQQPIKEDRVEIIGLDHSQLHSLALQLHQRKLRADFIVGDLASWQELLRFYLSSDGKADSEPAKEFFGMVAEYASNSPNVDRFYQTVLQKLQSNRLIDFEELTNEKIQILEDSGTYSVLENAEPNAGLFVTTGNRDVSPMPSEILADVINSVSPVLTSPTVQQKNEFKSSIDLTLMDSLQINQLVQQLRTKPAAARDVQGDSSSWRVLINTYLSTNVINDSENTSTNDAHLDFVNSIAAYAEQAADKIRFYQSVVSELVQDHLIDLELLAINEASIEQQSVFGGYEAMSARQQSQIESEISADPLQANEAELARHDFVRTPDQLHQYSLKDLLRSNSEFSSAQLLQLQAAIHAAIHQPDTVSVDWQTIFADAELAEKLVKLVPGHILHKLLTRLQPGRYLIIDQWRRLVVASLALLVPNPNSREINQAAWRCVVNLLFVQTQVADEFIVRRLVQDIARAAGVEDIQRLINLVQRRHGRVNIAKPVKTQFSQDQIAEKIRAAMASDALQMGLSLNNVGMVLIAPYLPRLFSMLGLVKDGEFLHLGAADRAVHLLQFIVTGESQTPEYELFLNKLLCGISTSIPVSAGIEITQNERDTIEQMLKSIIQHWSVLGSTSIAGLRETFLQRQGWLRFEEDGWYLEVKEGTFDMLIDYIPWGYSIVKYAWMDKPVHVKWRNKS